MDLTKALVLPLTILLNGFNSLTVGLPILSCLVVMSNREEQAYFIPQ